MDDATIGKSPLSYPSEHWSIVGMCVDAYVHTTLLAKVKCNVGYSCRSWGRSYTVDCTVSLVVGPFSINVRVIWFIAYDECKYS